LAGTQTFILSANSVGYYVGIEQALKTGLITLNYLLDAIGAHRGFSGSE
jgi:hypothetical protein